MRHLLIIILTLCVFETAAHCYVVNIYSRNNAKDQVGEVIIDNEIIMRLYDTIDRQDPNQRAEKIAQRLSQAVAVGVNPNDFKVKFVSGAYKAVIANRELFTVGKKEAQINQTSEDILAIEWIEKIRRLLKGMPVSEVKLSDSDASAILQQSAPAPVILENPVQETGMAAWFEGDNEDFVAVHSSLPVGAKIRVKNMSNGWSIVVKIIGNKNLPLGRIINVSKSAAQALGLIQAGPAKVTITSLVN